MSDVRVIVCGSRGWTDRDLIQDVLSDLVFEHPGREIVIVHGAAKGADRIAEQEAQKAGLLVEPHPYQPFISETVSAARAPLLRNARMAALGADLCIGFWDGRSTGTRHMLDTAYQAGINTRVVDIHGVQSLWTWAAE